MYCPRDRETRVVEGTRLCIAGGRSLVLDAWLTAQPEDAFKLLKQYPDTHMVATPVSRLESPEVPGPAVGPQDWYDKVDNRFVSVHPA